MVRNGAKGHHHESRNVTCRSGPGVTPQVLGVVPGIEGRDAVTNSQEQYSRYQVCYPKDRRMVKKQMVGNRCNLSIQEAR